MLIILINVASLLVFSIVSALPDQLHILWQLYLKELLGLLIYLGLLKLWYLIYAMLYLAIFCSFLAITTFKELWMARFCKKTQLMQEFIKGQFLSLLFSYNTLTTSLMMSPVIMSSMLLILLRTLIVIR